MYYKPQNIHLYNFDRHEHGHVIESGGDIYVYVGDKVQYEFADDHKTYGGFVRIGSIFGEDKNNAKLAKSAANTDAKTLIFYGVCIRG